VSRSLPAVFGEVELIDDLREPLQFRIGFDDIVSDADMPERFQTALLVLDATSTRAGKICVRNLCSKFVLEILLYSCYFHQTYNSVPPLIVREEFKRRTFFCAVEFGCKAKMTTQSPSSDQSPSTKVGITRKLHHRIICVVFPTLVQIGRA